MLRKAPDEPTIIPIIGPTFEKHTRIYECYLNLIKSPPGTALFGVAASDLKTENRRRDTSTQINQRRPETKGQKAD